MKFSDGDRAADRKKKEEGATGVEFLIGWMIFLILGALGILSIFGFCSGWQQNQPRYYLHNEKCQLKKNWHYAAYPAFKLGCWLNLKTEKKIEGAMETPLKLGAMQFKLFMAADAKRKKHKISINAFEHAVLGVKPRCGYYAHYFKGRRLAGLTVTLRLAKFLNYDLNLFKKAV